MSLEHEVGSAGKESFLKQRSYVGWLILPRFHSNHCDFGYRHSQDSQYSSLFLADTRSAWWKSNVDRVKRWLVKLPNCSHPANLTAADDRP